MDLIPPEAVDDPLEHLERIARAIERERVEALLEPLDVDVERLDAKTFDVLGVRFDDQGEPPPEERARVAVEVQGGCSGPSGRVHGPPL
jgi:hypothetical protein